MTQYMAFDSTVADPKPVLGWYDTGVCKYPSVPSSENLIEVTAAQWTAHMASPGGWAVSGGVLVAYTAPAAVLTLAQQAAIAANAGLTLTISGILTLAATLFPTDANTQTKISTMASMAARGVLPTGCTAYPMVDSAGTWHEFTATQYQAVAAALASYVADCDLIASAYPGAPTTLPAVTATLVLT